MKNLNVQIQTIASKLDIEIVDIFDLAKVSTPQRKRISTNLSKIPFVNLLTLSDALGLDFDSMISGQFDPIALREHFHGNKSYLPCRYQQYQMSRMATIQNGLEYSIDKIPPFYLQKIKRRLQITDEALGDLNRPVSGLLLMDLFQELSLYQKYGISFSEIGGRLCRNHMFQAVKKIPGKKIAPKKVFEAFIENIHSQVEFNLAYKIVSSSDRTLTVMVETRRETQDGIKKFTFGNEFHYQNIMGYYAEISKYFFKAAPRISRLSSWRDTNAELIFQLEHPQLSKSQSHYL